MFEVCMCHGKVRIPELKKMIVVGCGVDGLLDVQSQHMIGQIDMAESEYSTMGRTTS